MSWSFTVLALLLLAFASAGAQDRLDAVAAAADRATAAAEAPAVERMARFLATTPEALRAERASAGLGWGDLFLSHRIASRSGHPIEKVFAARRTGAPWGDIVSDAGVDPDLLVQDVAAVWPEAAGARPAAGGAARAVPPTAAPAGGPVAAPAGAPPAEAKGFGGRLLDVLRGAPEGSSGDAPADRTSEEIRDRMIRGGGTRPR